jgi:NADPH:quinone reductase-like Zn-dependent oxidoreductase/short-subunit dehydrogenase/acyl carrier protein
LDLQAARARCTEPVDAGAFHDGLARRGANFGPHFKRLLDARRGSDEAIARLAPPGAAGAASQAWMLHPALLDACLQLVSVAADGGTANANDDHLWIPARIGRVVWHASPAQPAWGHARLREAASTATLVADITAWSADATLLATLEAVQFMRASAAAISASAGVLPAHATPSLVERCALEWVWQPVDANAGAPADPPAAERASWCFVDDTGSRLGAALGQRLREHGATVVPAAAAGMPAAGATDIVLLAGPLLSRPFAPSAPDTIDDSAAIRRELDEATAVTASALSLVNRISVPPGGTPLRLWFVTRGAQAVRATESADARTATLWGLARVVRSERPELNCTAFDIDAACTADALVDALLRARRLDQRESQFALREGELLRSCLAPWPASAGAPLADRRFVAPRSGRLEDLRAEAVPAERLVPGPGEVCIDVRAAGLNFRDVLASIGMVASPVDALGGECAGRVVAVGAGVSGFVPGDEVFALALGGLATRVCVAQLYVVHRPSGVSPVQAAALPIACLTASYGLERLAGLKRGQRVLIHAATGGVGMAAVQLAQHLGAEVYATAGSQTKRDHLRSLGIRHVFDSRSLDFAREIREATGGAGVHVVLNALAGEFIEAGLALLSPGGCFLEMGKRGVWSSTQVAERFPSLRYHVFDLGDAAAADEALAPALFARLLARLAAGELTPLPVRTFPMREARAAFEQMAHARHIGKLVLVRDDSAPPLRCEVRADASYLVTGGFGALGLQVAEALVARGARHLVLLGRRPPGEAAKTVLDRLAARGVSIHPLFIDLSEVGAAEALAARWSALAARPPAHPTALPPLRGIVHCAGVIDDAVLARQDAGRVAKVLAPKLAGALALAAAAAQPDLEIELDFFVLFGAGAAWLGNAGQANYAAANTALDALAQTLRAQGRPATAIAWGRWQGAGMASAASGSAAWAALGIGEIAGAEGTAAMFECIERQAASVALLPMDWPTWLGKAFGDASRAPAAYDVVARRALAGSAAAQSSTKAAAARKPGALARLQAQPPHERREALQKVLEVQVRQVAGLASSQAIDPTWPLRELGLDSLMSVELRNALGGRFERSLSATLVFDHPTLNALTDYLMRTLPGLLEADTAAEAAAHTPDATRLAAAPIATARRAAETEALQALSDEQAEARLLAELSQGTGR